jgi:hypothetical protein
VVALQDRARNEPRDLYDLWFLTTRAGIEIGDLIGAIAEKLRFREKEIAGLEDRIIAKEARLRTLTERDPSESVQVGGAARFRRRGE